MTQLGFWRTIDTTGGGFFAECLRHSAKADIHSTKYLPSVTLGKGRSVNSLSVKTWFVLRDEEEVKLWHLLREKGLSMGSDIALTRAKLKKALERVELVHQTMTIDLPHVADVNFLCSRCCLLISSIRP